MKLDLGLGKVLSYFASGLFLCDMLVSYKNPTSVIMERKKWKVISLSLLCFINVYFYIVQFNSKF